MRLMIPLVLLSLAACAPQGETTNTTATNATASPERPGLRGDEPANSPSALAARAVVEQYFTSVEKQDYQAAYRLWGNGGKDSGGSPESFANSFAGYAKFEPETGDPSEIHARDGMQYILVAARAHVENKKTGKTAEREGTVALRRSVDPDDPVVDKRDWRIWSVDLRVPH